MLLAENDPPALVACAKLGGRSRRTPLIGVTLALALAMSRILAEHRHDRFGPPMLVRQAIPADAHGIARVQVDTWRATYHDMLPADHLAQLSYEQAERRWEGILGAANTGGSTYIAEDGLSAITGFASGGPNRTQDPLYRAELWLHVSDFHFRGGAAYDRDVVLRALIVAVRDFRAQGRQPDLIFATGDIAFSGKPAEYEQATRFLDALVEAAGLTRRELFVVPGNHDVDRDQGIGLARTLDTREVIASYFAPHVSKPHLTLKMDAFRQWYDHYFAGIRACTANSTCGPLEIAVVRDAQLAVLPVNSALFCQGDDDHAKLLIDRRCLDAAIEELKAANADLKIALLHHPLDWLSDIERSNIRASFQANFDLILRGHLHETDVETVAAVTGSALHIAAGASYQTRKWPNRALYATFEQGTQVRIFPIRYEDCPTEVWTVDPSVFPHVPGYERSFTLPRDSPAHSAAPTAPPEILR